MRYWTGKLLLLGEYTVLLGGEALAVPLGTYGGHWTDGPGDPHAGLCSWAEWLEGLRRKNGLPWAIDTAAFLDFVQQGGRFQSTVPPGCGLGSSGALVAGLTDRWSTEQPAELQALQQGLATLESYFHGSSSGLDPLVSLLGQAVLLAPPGLPRALGQLPLPEGLFLYDSGLRRHTAPLVAAFRRQITDIRHRNAVETALLPPLRRAVEALLLEDRGLFREAFIAISETQRTLFADMIPEAVRSLWSGPGYRLKLCGAGGGGYFLGLADDPQDHGLDPGRIIRLNP
jgi:mevalonate kinase